MPLAACAVAVGWLGERLSRTGFGLAVAGMR
jgi:hypothetical protein